MVEKKIKEEYFVHVKIIWNSDFSGHKVLLEHLHARPFLCCLWLPVHFNSRSECYNRDHLALCRKNLLNPGFALNDEEKTDV